MKARTSLFFDSSRTVIGNKETEGNFCKPLFFIESSTCIVLCRKTRIAISE